MALTVKRKRGRPRRDEPRQINEFDEALIREFQMRPVLYDRSHPMRSRDTVDIWNEIAAALGQTPNMVKDRMLQLRNRYNLEKRRIESMQEQYNDPNINSQWVLFEKLDFLSDHIKARRSYGRDSLPMQPSMLQTRNSHSSNYMEQDVDDDEEEDVEQEDEEDEMVDVTSKPNVNSSSKITQKTTFYNNHKNFNNIAHEQQPGYLPAHNNVHNALKEHNLATYQITSKNRTGEKYRAFGEFLTYSLMEMNDKEALRLVEKFTSEVVKTQLGLDI